MATLETRVGEIQERRRAAVVAANDRLRQIAGQLGIKAKLETQTPTVGVAAFIPHATGNAIVPVSQLEDLADRIKFLEEELARWQKIDGQAGL